MRAELDIGSARRPNVLLEKIDRVLEQNFASRDFDLLKMAEGMGISERQLQRKLKELTGHTPSAYIRSYRLYKSLDHLKSGESVSQSAKAVGFSSQSYFAFCFRVEFGITPTKYQQGIDKLITQPWSIRPQIAFHTVAQFQDENARDRKNL